MYFDPRSHDEFHLRNVAESAKERRSKSGLAALPTFVLIWLIPFLLIARAAVWTWRRVRPAKS